MASDRQALITFTNVSVPASSVLGQVGGGWPTLTNALQRAATAKCVEMSGGAEAVLDMTVEYVKNRVQFGRPVGSFQAVQHHCANMATDVEGIRLTAYQAAWRISDGQPAAQEVALAKAWVSDAYQRVCELAHQCHGAIGFTQEHNLQLYTRRARMQETAYGNANYHREANGPVPRPLTQTSHYRAKRPRTAGTSPVGMLTITVWPSSSNAASSSAIASASLCVS